MSEQFIASNHPLVKHKLAYLCLPREKIDSQTYVALLREMGTLLTAEAVALSGITFPGPPGHKPVGRPSGNPPPRWPVLVSTVRHGLIMAEGARSIMPTRHMAHIGVFVVPDTGEVKEFMVTMPTDNIEDRLFFILDAFVATGRTAKRIIEIVQEFGVLAKHIMFVCVAVAAEGRKRLEPLAEEGVRFYSGHIEDEGSSYNWTETFKSIQLNERLYGTPNKNFG
jgi:uracil phosphoribosyltransferase